jgi:hypothetical protein
MQSAILLEIENHCTFSFNTRDSTQGLECTKQVLYHLNTPPFFYAFSLFFRWGLVFTLADPGPQSSYLYVLYSSDYSCAPTHPTILS